MKLLLVSDVHFSSGPVDEFMFGLFDQLKQIIRDESIDEVICLGDLCEAKTGHSSELVNRVVDGFVELSKLGCEIRLLLGNHDLTAGAMRPFFEFLNHYPKIQFITQPTEVKYFGFRHVKALFLPHTRDPGYDWRGLELGGKLVFAHVTVNDCIAENGQKLQSSVESTFFNDALVTYAGDIHKAQTMNKGKFIYLGSPYCTKFINSNKTFEGRVLIVDTEDPIKYESRRLDFPLRLTFDVLDIEELKTEVNDAFYDFQPKAQVKFRLHLNEVNMGRWRDIKDELKQFAIDYQWQLCDIALVKDHLDTAQAVIPRSKNKYLDFDTYCDANHINESLRVYGARMVETIK